MAFQGQVLRQDSCFIKNRRLFVLRWSRFSKSLIGGFMGYSSVLILLIGFSEVEAKIDEPSKHPTVCWTQEISPPEEYGCHVTTVTSCNDGSFCVREVKQQCHFESPAIETPCVLSEKCWLGVNSRPPNFDDLPFCQWAIQEFR
jgi:hypothetical protein